MIFEKLHVYVTGPHEASNPIAQDRNRQNLSLVCRRVLLAGHVPICPTLLSLDWKKDPRISNFESWWAQNFYKPLMAKCSVFCYIMSPAGYRPERIELEKEVWREVGDGKFILADFILDHLLNINKDRIFGS